MSSLLSSSYTVEGWAFEKLTIMRWEGCVLEVVRQSCEPIHGRRLALENLKFISCERCVLELVFEELQTNTR